jgi:mevalonate pyrophosphate decarboxylase
MVKNGAAMIGMWVEVYTNDDQRHIYQISQVLRHVSGSAALSTADAATTDQLWLQTSEGPFESSTKLQVVAQPVGVIAASQADAHPTGKGNVCPDAPRCKAPGNTGCRP